MNGLRLLIFIFPLFQAAAQSDLEFAGHLMAEGDYFRAISEYKKISFFTKAPETKNHCLLQIGKAYYRSGKHQSSIETFSRLMSRCDSVSQCAANCNIYLGLNYYQMNLSSLAGLYFSSAAFHDTSGLASFYLALLDADRLEWEHARDLYESLAVRRTGTELGNISRELSADVTSLQSVGSRSPVLAATLSALVPGLGQAYADHYYDAVQSFTFVAAFLFASYTAYRYDQNINHKYVTTGIALSITAVFHLANIIGAERTADYYNMRARQAALAPIRKKALRIESSGH